MKQPTNRFERVGDVAVDSGLLWVGDPCYFITDTRRKDPIAIQEARETRTWMQFLHGFAKASSRAFRFRNGGKGLGVAIGGFGGDGVYPVYVRRDSKGLVREIVVVFD